MGGIDVRSSTQRIVVKSQQRIVVEDQRVDVINSPQGVAIVNAGPPGPRGFTGPVGGRVSNEGEQTTPALVWIIDHNLGFNPAAEKFFTLDGLIELEPESVTYVNTNQSLATWPEPIAGKWMVS